LGIRVITLVFLSVMSGCTPPVKKVTHVKTDGSSHHPIAAATGRAHHQLSQSEKDKLFKDFQRWLAAKKQADMKAPPLVEVDGPLPAH
jgi:hypothetical protein